MDTIKITARTQEDASYVSPEHHGLQVTLAEPEGYVRLLTIENRGEHPFVGVVHLELVFRGEKPSFFMPAFLYNRNRGNAAPYRNAAGEYLPFPRLARDSELVCAADHWMVRGDRLSHPVSMAVCGGRIYAVAADPVSKWGFNGFSCRLGQEESSVGVTIGYENAPWHYIFQNDILKPGMPGTLGTITLEPGQSLSAQVEVFCGEAQDERAVNGVIRHVYDRYYQPPRTGTSIREAVQSIADAISRDAYVTKLRTYSTRVFMEGERVRQEELASISWTGGLEVAVPMLYAAARLNRPDIREQALSVIENIVDRSMNEQSHLPFDAFDGDRWFTDGWWACFQSGPGHSAYLVGQALYYVLMAYDLEKRSFGQEHRDWLAWVRGCLDHIEHTKNASGEVPYLWSARDGSALEYDSFAGCWCVAAAAYYDALLGDSRYLEGCKKSVLHYYTAYVRHMECYGTPLDTQKAVDSEGILPFVKACRLLHQMTGQAEFLQMLSDGLEYEFTFKFCWNPPIEAEPLHRIGWTACGGSVTSTCNPHIHPMSNNVSDELAYCYSKTHDPYLKRRLDDTTAWALQTYSTFDGEYDYGKKGWMSERFCYSQALLIEKYPDGSPCSTWKCFLPWGASNILEGLCGSVWDNHTI